MSYIVLARKYRPQKLDGIIGQEVVVQILSNAIIQQRVHHGYLLTGARGVGKTSIARIMAKSLNCQTGPTLNPCEQCVSCNEITKSISPDVLEIDGASHTSVDDVREIKETVQYAPLSGRYKIYIIDEVHMLSTNAFNALLKTLEEPPKHVIFIFATTEPHKIPITILSRCQRLDFRRVSTEKLATRLHFVCEQEGIRINPDALFIIAKAADGSVRDAMSLLDQVIAYAASATSVSGTKDSIQAVQTRAALGILEKQKIIQLTTALIHKERSVVSALIHESYAQSVDLKELGEQLLETIRDLALIKFIQNEPTPAELAHLLPEEIEFFKNLVAPLSHRDIQRLFEVIHQTLCTQEKSAFEHLVFEMGLLKACDLAPIFSIDELIQQFNQLSSTQVVGNILNTHKISTQTQESASVVTIQSPKTNNQTTPTNTSTPPIKTQSMDWKTLIHKIQKERPALAAAFEHMRCLQFNQTGAHLEVSEENFILADLVEDKESKEYWNQVTQKTYGTPLVLQIQRIKKDTNETPNKPLTLAQEREKNISDRAFMLKQQAEQHPSIQHALSILGAHIKSIDIAKENIHLNQNQIESDEP